MVMVLGETARAANWGLSGYARQTTPELAAEEEEVGAAQHDAVGIAADAGLEGLHVALDGLGDLDDAGVAFTNGGEPGVKMRRAEG